MRGNRRRVAFTVTEAVIVAALLLVLAGIAMRYYQVALLRARMLQTRAEITLRFECPGVENTVMLSHCDPSYRQLAYGSMILPGVYRGESGSANQPAPTSPKALDPPDRERAAYPEIWDRDLF